MKTTRLTKVIALAAAATLAGTLSACSSDSTSGDAGSSTKLSLVAYSVAKAGDNAVEKAFAATDAGKGVTWEESYGASGDQSRAVVSGLDADVVHFSLESDVTRLVDSDLVASDWNTGATKGILTSSVVVLVVRKGNPKNIQGWDDLIKPGVQIVTPNPGSSGSARWNILAAYGHVLANGGDDATATEFLTNVYKNIVALPGSGRDATTAFTGGTGDVLLSYENEAILGRQQGEDYDYVVPDDTLLIENPAAVTKDADPKAKAFLDYATSAAGQTEYAKVGFRPVVDGVSVQVEGANDPANPFPTPNKLETITDDFGGWPAAAKKFFDENDGIVTKIQAAQGKA